MKLGMHAEPLKKVQPAVHANPEIAKDCGWQRELLPVSKPSLAAKIMPCARQIFALEQCGARRGIAERAFEDHGVIRIILDEEKMTRGRHTLKLCVIDFLFKINAGVGD